MTETLNSSFIRTLEDEGLTTQEKLFICNNPLAASRAVNAILKTCQAMMPGGVPDQGFDALAARSVAVAEVVEYFVQTRGITITELKSERRLRPLAHPRQELMYLLAELTGASIPRIGAFLKRDHTTVLYGIMKVKKRMLNDASVAERLQKDIAAFVEKKKQVAA